MKTFVYYSLPAHGHTNPTLPIFKELVAKGHTVLYYSLPEFKEKIERTGAIFRLYPEGMQLDPRVSKNVSLFGKQLVKVADEITDSLIAEIKNDQIDCIIYDSFSLWGKTTSTFLHIPAVVFYTTIAFNERVLPNFLPAYVSVFANGLFAIPNLISGYNHYKRIAKKYGFRAESFNNAMFNTEQCNIVFTSQYFQPGSAQFDKTFHFIGPSIDTRHDAKKMFAEIPSNKKIIYISVGTIFNDNLQFFITCIKAFEHSDYFVILSLGHRFTVKDLPYVPPNFLVQNSVPQLEVLKKADIFISHGGMNSINESLYYGVPLILVPQMVEQHINALRVKKLGAGIIVPRNYVTSEKLRSTVGQVLEDKKFAVNALKIRQTLHDAGGYKKAVDILLQFISP